MPTRLGPMHFTRPLLSRPFVRWLWLCVPNPPGFPGTQETRTPRVRGFFFYGTERTAAVVAGLVCYHDGTAGRLPRFDFRFRSAAWLGRCSSRSCPRRRVHAPTRYRTLCRTRRMRGNACMVGDSSPCARGSVCSSRTSGAHRRSIGLYRILIVIDALTALNTALRQGADVATSDEHLVALDGFFLFLGHAISMKRRPRRNAPPPPDLRSFK